MSKDKRPLTATYEVIYDGGLIRLRCLVCGTIAGDMTTLLRTTCSTCKRSHREMMHTIFIVQHPVGKIQFGVTVSCMVVNMLAFVNALFNDSYIGIVSLLVGGYFFHRVGEEWRERRDGKHLLAQMKRTADAAQGPTAAA